MKRTVFHLLIAALFLLSCLPTVTAETLSGICGDTLTWTYYPDTAELVIAGNGAMYRYEQGDQPWYDLDFSIIRVENGVTSIGREAFAGCCAMTTVYIAESVTSIGYFGFGGYPRCVIVDSPTIAAAATVYDA